MVSTATDAQQIESDQQLEVLWFKVAAIKQTISLDCALLYWGKLLTGCMSTGWHVDL